MAEGNTGARDNNNKMDACTAVGREIEKVLNKFTSYSDHASGTITALHGNLESLQHEVNQGESRPPPAPDA